MIRDHLAVRGEDPTRENMIRTGNQLREAGGPGALATHIIAKLDVTKRIVVDSIRNPVEVEVLRGLVGFALLEVTAPESVRFERIKARGRIGDPTDIATFRELEQRELTGDPTGQQLVATAALADHRVVNDGSLDVLHRALSALIEQLS